MYTDCPNCASAIERSKKLEQVIKEARRVFEDLFCGECSRKDLCDYCGVKIWNSSATEVLRDTNQA